MIIPQLTLKCSNKKAPPHPMVGGSATSDHQFCYLTPGCTNSVYSYQWSTDEWKQLPQCPYRSSALAIINGELTAVGGEDGSCSTRKLFTLRKGRWVEEYPPMNTTRSRTSVVSISDGKYIIVLGGKVGRQWTTSAELFEASSRRWYQVTNLPQSLAFPSATICGNQLHVIAGTEGYSCFVQSLLSSDKPITPQLVAHLIAWTPLPRLRLVGSTPVALSGQLVVIGTILDTFIQQLLNGEWEEIDRIDRGTPFCLVVNPSPNKMIIMGFSWVKEYYAIM